MSGPPEVFVTGGSPTPEEERAIREAIVALWRDDQAAAAREAGGLGGWHRAAREEGTGARMWSRAGWRGAETLNHGGGVLGARRVGRGDQR